MEKPKYSIKIEASDLKLIPNPKKELRILASKISTEDAYASVFPKDSPQDILYVSLVSFTIGHINKNDCLILPDEGLATYKSAIRKPIDIEHECTDIVGVCVNAYLTNIKNNKILDEEAAQEILDGQGLVNVGNVFAIWKLNNPDVADLISENFDNQSSNYGRLKASFEYYFNDFSFFVSNGTADYPNGELISSGDDNPNAEAMNEALKIKGGNGKWQGNRISIVPHDGFVGGNALTLNPANGFSDVTGAKDNGKIIVQLKEESSTTTIEKSVIKDIGDSNMPEIIKTPVAPEVKVEAALVPIKVDETLANSMQAALDVKIKELGAKDLKLSEMEASIQTLTQSLEEAKKETLKTVEMANKLQVRLDEEIKARNLAESKETERIQLALVASRLAKVGEFVKIDDSNKALLEKECASVSEEDFVKRLEFYKSIANKVVATEIPPLAKEVTEPKEVKDAVQQVVSDTAKDTKSVNIIAATPSDSLVEKFAKAFNIKTLGFTDKRLK